MSNEELYLKGENYYDILESSREDSDEQIKQNYQRLVRKLHPDKRPEHTNDIESKTNMDTDWDERFLALQQAWNVLKDPQCRRRYNAALACYEHADILLYETLGLAQLNYDSSEQIYTYPCRCGGSYVVNEDDVTNPEVTIGCNECSFSILVQNPT